MKAVVFVVSFLIASSMSASASASAANPRARDLGVPFDGTPGPLNAITDVAGVEVGHQTLIYGEGKKDGPPAVRTGVTAILPGGKSPAGAVFAGLFSLNGNGEMTGAAWVEESGLLEGPVMLTNTHSVGVVRDSVIAWRLKHGGPDSDGFAWSLPVVAETWDGDLNDINGFHVKQKHVFAALDGASSGPVAEGAVGGGTGMICHEFKGGIGTASRRVKYGETTYTVGALVQANYGKRYQLRIAGIPVGAEMSEDTFRREEKGSIIVVLATDAPLLPHQLKRIARRASMGLARMGSVSGNGSGDLFLAFSTANPESIKTSGLASLKMIPNDVLDPFFEASIQSVEESIVNALVAAHTMTGNKGFKVRALPHERLKALLKKHGRLVQASAPTP